MKITWIGHSCFKIEEGGHSIVIDPYDDNYVPGLKPVRESAQVVLASHEHGDHNARNRVTLVPGGEGPFTITKIETYHDPEGKRSRISAISDANWRKSSWNS